MKAKKIIATLSAISLIFSITANSFADEEDNYTLENNVIADDISEDLDNLQYDVDDESVESFSPEDNIVEMFSDENAVGGVFGNNGGMSWHLNIDDGTMIISGNDSLSYSSKSPWNEYSSQIKNVTVEFGVTLIGYRWFANCRALESISIPNSVTKIEQEAFNDCRLLPNIEIPNSVVSIGIGAFKYCDLLDNVTIPLGVTEVASETFYSCNSLKNIVIPDSVTSIGYNAFWSCKALESITIPNNVTRINESAFKYCTSLENIDLSSKLQTIGESAFAYCKLLKNITIPNSVTKIEKSTFANCNALNSITIPASVTDIDVSAFSACDSMESIYVDLNNKKYSDVNGVLFNKRGTSILFYPNTKTNKYEIPDTVTTIGPSAFYNKGNLEEITIPKSVMVIGNYAFQHCSGLTKMQLPDGVLSIGASAFSFCSNLSEINIPSNITSIEDSTFTYTKIKEIVLPDTVTSIGSRAFAECSELTSFKMSNNIISIGYNAFANCDGIQQMKLPESLTDIGDEAFYLGPVYYTYFYVNKGSVADTYLQSISAHRINYIDDNTTLPEKPNYDESDVWDGNIADGFTWGNGSESNPYLITSGAQLAYMTKHIAETKANNEKYNMALTYSYLIGADIDLNNIPWTPIGNPDLSFHGIFDGGYHTISGLYINSEEDYVGLFGYGNAYSGGGIDIKNLIIKDSEIKGNDYVGAIIGYCNRGSVYNCTNYSNISGSSAIGGIVGYSVAWNCNDGIECCVNYGNITGKSEVGGITGSTYDVYIGQCNNIGNVYGDSNVGGIIGRDNINSAIGKCGNSGKITAINSSAGGIIGRDNADFIHNCYNIGDIQSKYNAGGIIGYTVGVAGGIQARSEFYNAGHVSAESGSDAIVGGNSYAIGYAGLGNNYCLSGVSPVRNDCDTKAVSSVALQQQSTFENWDFETIWDINPSINKGYPYLKCNTDMYTPEEEDIPTQYNFKYSQTPVSKNTYKKSKYNDFLNSASMQYVIPGLNETVIPQGMAYRKDTNQYYISGYTTNGENSVLMVIDKNTGKYVGEYYLKKTNGEPFTGHAGGIAVTNKNLFIANGKSLSRVSLSTIDSIDHCGDLQFEENIKLSSGDAAISFCDYSDGVLWIGNFYYNTDSYNSKAYKNIDSAISGYCLDESTDNEFDTISVSDDTNCDYVPNYICKIPDRIQGVTAFDNRLALSQSYGRMNDSKLYIYNNPIKFPSVAVDIVTIGTKSIPVYDLEILENIKSLPMMEDLTSVNDSIYAMYESGSEKYRNGCSASTDRFWRIDISQNDTDDYPIIVLPGIMGSTLKADGMLGVPVLTEDLSFVSPNDIEIADSLAAGTGANDFVAALKNDGHKVYTCPYDWRLSIDKAAELYLKPMIDKALKATGKDKVILIAHSMGGLVSRSYIQSNNYENDVEALYMLGTPNMGSTAIIPLAMFGVPYDGAQAMVLKYNYDKMTGEDYNKASLKEVKSFVNNKVLGATQLLPTYNASGYDVNSKTYFQATSNSFLSNLNSTAISSNRYQKIDDNNPNKVRTMLIAANDSDTPNALKLKVTGDTYNLQYKSPLLKNRVSYVANVAEGVKYVETIDSVGDGTVLLRSATGHTEKFDNIWTIEKGAYGTHMKLMKSLTNKMQKYLSPAEKSILKNVELFSMDSSDEDIPEIGLQIDISGASTANIQHDEDEPEDILLGYYIEDVQDGDYTITVARSDSPRSTIQLAYTCDNVVETKVYSFVNENNEIHFRISEGKLTIDEKVVNHVRSLNNNGKALIRWDNLSNAISYKIYKKNANESGYEFVDEIENIEYQTQDQWCEAYTDSCIKYYIVPVFTQGDGGFDTSAYNFNNTTALFDYEIMSDNPTMIQFTDMSQGDITSWEWDFDSDGVVDSTEQNPIKTFDDGKYSVTLTVSGASGTDILTMENLINSGNCIKRLSVDENIGVINIGEQKQFKINAVYDDGSIKELQDNVICFLSDDDIVTLEDNTIIGKNRGTATITIMYDDVQTMVDITVTDDDFVIQSVDNTEEGIDVNLFNSTSENKNAVVVLAVYNDLDILKSVQVQNVNMQQGNNYKKFTNVLLTDNDNIKVFLWEDFSSMLPLANSYKMK